MPGHPKSSVRLSLRHGEAHLSQEGVTFRAMSINNHLSTWGGVATCPCASKRLLMLSCSPLGNLITCSRLFIACAFCSTQGLPGLDGEKGVFGQKVSLTRKTQTVPGLKPHV